ncbi:MAG: AAA-associated domain-containing protein [Candidatus Micrarchaeaceae archaeon]
MDSLFPLNTGISRVRGIISLVKQSKGRIEMSELAEESEEDIDDLLPLIEACKLLGFVTVDESELRLTEKGAQLTFSNFSRSIKAGLVNVEPFKSTIKILDDKEIPSPELFSKLKSRSIIVHGEEWTNEALLKKLLIRWGVRAGLLRYNPDNDTWRRSQGK